jgi:hypothetical protein
MQSHRNSQSNPKSSAKLRSKRSAVVTATVLSSPNYDLVELKLQQMGLLVKRAATITSTATATISATTLPPPV